MPGRQIFISLLVLPTVISPIVAGATWRLLFDNRYGPINQIIGWFAGHPVPLLWTVNPETRLSRHHLLRDLAVDAVHVPDPAGRSVQCRQLTYEAAEIDGARFWRTFRHVVLPAIWPVMAIAILIRGLDLFRIFDIIWALTTGGPGTMTETISIYTYVQGFKQFEIELHGGDRLPRDRRFSPSSSPGRFGAWGWQNEQRSVSSRARKRNSSSAISPRRCSSSSSYSRSTGCLPFPSRRRTRSFAFPPVWYPKSIQFNNYAVLFKDGDAKTVWQQPGACFGINLLRHDLRHHRRLLTGALQRPAAKTSPCGSSRSA